MCVCVSLPKQELLGSSPQKKKERSWRRGSGAEGPRSLDGWHEALELGACGVWMGGTRLWSWGPAEFGWVARGSGSGAGGPRFWLRHAGWHARHNGWHAARSGARGVCNGWVAHGSGGGPRVWMGGTGSTPLTSWGPAEFGWVARGSGTGGGGPRSLDGWHAALEQGTAVPGTFNIDGLSAGWVTACTHTC